MHIKHLSVFALAGSAFAQSPSLVDALKNATDLSQLYAFIGSSQPVLAALGNATNITILAPSNEAFSKIDNGTLSALAQNQDLIGAILDYHVLQGVHNSSSITNTSVIVPTLLNNTMYANVTGGQVVKVTRRNNNVTIYSGLLNNSTVSKADIQFNGGVIHIIDRLLTVPPSISDTLLAAGLTSVRGALQATNLTDAVNYTPNITVFAPLNEAIRDIGSALGNLSSSQIADILKYHVVATGPIGYSTVLKNGTKLTTLAGQNLTITTGSGGVFVNNARVVTADLLVANGVLHVIDQVLNPTNQTIANSTNSQGVPAFSGASAVSEAPYTSGQPSATTTIPAAVTSAAADPTNTSSTSSTKNAAPAMQTGAVGMSALLGVAAVYLL